MIDAVVHRITIHRLQIPLRKKVSHAAAAREFSEPIIVTVEFVNGIIGYGETLPQKDVTGETCDTVVRDLQEIFAPIVMKFHARSFPEALECIDSLPIESAGGRIITAARAAIELALLDASMRAFNRDMDAVVQWMGLAGFGSPGSIRRIRFSGILAAVGDHSTMRMLQRMYWTGIRHFNLEVGFDGDRDRQKKVADYLCKAIARGHATLRVDANGAWSPEQAANWIVENSDLPIAAIEQPVARGNEPTLLAVLNAVAAKPDSMRPLSDNLPMIIYDDSLITREDAERLINLGGPMGFNIRISKCGGLLPSLRLAAIARRAEIAIQLGCTAGETSILSAAGLRFLEACPDVRWAEGCFGSHRLAGDVVGQSLGYGLSGKPPRLRGPGLGVEGSPLLLAKHAETEPIVLNL